MRSHLRDPYVITVVISAGPSRAETAIKVQIEDSNGVSDLIDAWAPVNDAQVPRFVAEVLSVAMRLGTIGAASWLKEHRIARR